MSFGRPYILKTSGCIHDGWLVLSPKSEEISPDFFYHLLGSETLYREFSKRAAGAVVRNLNSSLVRQVRIPLPPLPEQRRIAAILDKADAVRRKRRQTLDLADRFLRSAFLDLFGDPGIPSATIGDLLAQGLLLVHKDGNHGSQYPRAEEFGDEGIPFLTARSITDSGAINDTQVQRLAEEKARQLKIGWLAKDDVLLAHNATVGRTAIYRGEYREALIGTSLTAFRTDSSGLVPMYLLGALRSARFQHQLASMMSQTTRNQVPITAQRRLSIPVPRIEEQREYALLVEKAAHHSMNLSRGSVTVQELQDSLTQRAFRGEL